MKIYFLKPAVLLCLAFSIYPFNAIYASPILITDGSGTLIGADDVDVNGTLYDVRFVEGSCVDIYDGCDAQSDFPFTYVFPSGPATQALSDQVLTGVYDLDPTLTFGCSNGSTWCSLSTPVGFPPFPNQVRVEVFYNYVDEGDDLITTGTRSVGTTSAGTFSTGLDTVYVTWTLANAIPEPGTGLLLVSAAVGFTISRRKSRKNS